MAQDRSLPPLTALQAFSAAGRAESFVEAAQTLSVTPSAISHQIRALEEWLSTPLFVRGTRQVHLTREGKDLLAAIDHAFARIRTAADGIRAAQAKISRLRVSALPFFTNTWLIPRLPSFARVHPDIVLDIDTSAKLVDFRTSKVDVAIRNTRRAPTAVAAKKILDIRMVPVCAPKLLSGPAALRHPRDLARHTLIHTSVRPDSWSRWLAAAGCGGLVARQNVSFDTVPAALEAAARGIGVGLAMDPLFWTAPIARDLAVPFASPGQSDSSYYLVHRKGARSPALGHFVNWIEREMAEFRRDAQRNPLRKAMLKASAARLLLSTKPH
jgi:LysR family glycine cleavage system transcriptional activator